MATNTPDCLASIIIPCGNQLEYTRFLLALAREGFAGRLPGPAK